MYAISFNFCGQRFKLRRKKPSFELDLFVMLFMCADQFKSLDMVMPRYFSWATVCSMWLFREYRCVRGCRALAMVIMLHFLALNLIPQVSPHNSRAARSLCRASWSSTDWMGRYKRQSSANSRTCEVTTLGRSLMWRRNSSGPSTEPCGTPESTDTWLDFLPSTTTRVPFFPIYFII